MMIKKNATHKLGIIVPYRNREHHLVKFLTKIKKFLVKKNINHEIIIIKQDDGKLFNRGMLLNIGFRKAKKLRCDYVCYHDVDLIPIRSDYSYSDHPIHLANGVFRGKRKMEDFDQYFGGVTIFPVKDFEKINGYSNKYWGWGFEDTDLLYRCHRHGISLDKSKIKNMGTNEVGVKFNGINSYVRGLNTFNYKGDLSFFISFNPEEITYDHKKDVDYFPVFSIPGYDFLLYYNSFERYGFSFFNQKREIYFGNSKIKPPYKTNISITINQENSTIKFYQDGKHITTIKDFGSLKKYQRKKYFYLGVTDPKRINSDYYKGVIDYFGVFNGCLTDDDVFELSTTEKKEKSGVFEKHKKRNNVALFYSGRKINNYELIDLSGNKNHGEIINCEFVEREIEDFKVIRKPKRRTGVFQTLFHNENGFVDNKWKNQHTRWNQLRFINEVLKNPKIINEDGLNDLKYTVHGEVRLREDKITQITVGI